MVLGLICTGLLLSVAFFSHSPVLNFVAFGPGDSTFLFAIKSGLVVLVFGRTSGEVPHHLYVLLCSLLFWWLTSAALIAVIRCVFGRVRT